MVVGAGPAGLCARRLTAAGVDVLGLEAPGGVGGRVATGAVDGFLVDRGFRVHNTAYPEAARILDHSAPDLRSADWEHLATVPAPRALPAAPAPLELRRPVRLGDALYVAGDHRDTPSIRGAMVSGRRAATAVLRARQGRAAA